MFHLWRGDGARSGIEDEGEVDAAGESWGQPCTLTYVRCGVGWTAFIESAGRTRVKGGKALP